MNGCRNLFQCLSITLMVVMQLASYDAVAQGGSGSVPLIQEYGEGGNTQMLYDRRQRPQSLYYEGLVYIVYNGGANQIDPKEGEDTYPHIITYNPETGKLSAPIKLAAENGDDQHFSPVIWMDKDNYIHVFYGFHNAKDNKHIVTRQPGDIGTSAADWRLLPEVRYSMSYPSVYNINGGRQVVYYRGEGHPSYWTYSISGNNGASWTEAPHAVTDLNAGDDYKLDDNPSREEAFFIDESSSYQCVVPSEDGKFLHVAFSWYEDNKKNNAEKFWNPRYGTNNNLGLKYNLYYVKINLENHEVRNYAGDSLATPMKLDYADSLCMIWDTDWRGSGKPAFINLDENGEPTFIHCLSSDNDLEQFNFWYVRRDGNQWKKTLITSTNHSWSSCYSKTRDGGKLHAWLVRSNLPDYSGWMDSRGGGNLIEEWVSDDQGNTWVMVQDIAPKDPKYDGWRFNCIQPVRDRDGKDIDSLHIFYGWKDPDLHLAKAFIADERFTLMTDSTDLTDIGLFLQPEIFDTPKIKYSNFSRTLFLTDLETTGTKVDVINLQGQIVLSNQSNHSNLSIPMGSISKGMYVVRISSGSKMKAEKILVW